MEPTRTDLVFVGLAVGLGLLCYGIGGAQAFGDALVQAITLLLNVLPQLAGGLLIGGMVKQLVGRDRIAALLGADTGLRGLITATAAGALTPGGPFMSFPIAYALWTAGAGAGVLVTYIAAWALLGLAKLAVWELPLMGMEFASVRFLVSLPLPIIAGLVAGRLSRLRVFRFRTGAQE
jgi:uncharacterized membrane protein YraQ (UPF0718 family)